MRKEIEQLKKTITDKYQEEIDLIDQLGDAIILNYSKKICGVCKCKGKGGYALYHGEYVRCEGNGKMEIDCEYDPCGRNNYTYDTCSNLEPIPQLFKDAGVDI